MIATLQYTLNIAFMVEDFTSELAVPQVSDKSTNHKVSSLQLLSFCSIYHKIKKKYYLCILYDMLLL